MTIAGRSFVYVSCSKGDCIDVLALDRESGELSKIEQVALPGNGMPLAIAPNGQFVYAAVASLGTTGGPQYETFRVAAATGKLSHVATISAPGRMSHITVDRSGRHLLGASVSNDLISSTMIESDGSLRAEPTMVQKVPSKAHQITTDLSGKYAYVPNLGADLVMQLVFDAETGQLTDNADAHVKLPAGAAPRHIAHHPNGRFAYLLNEEDGSLIAYSVDVGTGLLGEVGRSDFLPEGFDGKAWGAQILVRSDGRFLYASDRTSSTISLHEIDPESGQLTKRSSRSTEACPRNFTIDRSGRWLIVAGEQSNRVACYAIDASTGELQEKSVLETGAGPLWVEVLDMA